MERPPRRWLLALGAVFCAMGSAAADGGAGSISGRVLDASTGRPLPGAVVVAASPGAPPAWSALAGADGAFTLGDLPVGRYDLTAQLDGYQPSTRPALLVAEGVAARAELALTPEVVRLEEVLVTGSRLRRKDLTSLVLREPRLPHRRSPFLRDSAKRSSKVGFRPVVWGNVTGIGRWWIDQWRATGPAPSASQALADPWRVDLIEASPVHSSMATRSSFLGGRHKQQPSP